MTRHPLLVVAILGQLDRLGQGHVREEAAESHNQRLAVTEAQPHDSRVPMQSCSCRPLRTKIPNTRLFGKPELTRNENSRERWIPGDGCLDSKDTGLLEVEFED